MHTPVVENLWETMRSYQVEIGFGTYRIRLELLEPQAPLPPSLQTEVTHLQVGEDKTEPTPWVGLFRRC